MPRQTRRTFLKRASAAGLGAGIVIAGTKASGRVLGANDTIRVGVAGIHGRGGSHIGAFAGMKGVQVTHLIDPDSRLFASRSGQVKSKGGNTPKCFQDIRKALEDKDLDAVSIASCNHWHSLLTILSCQAGKDVYVEKPCSHNVFEGRKCVEAARKHQRIVQHGTQRRSMARWARQIAAIASGKYGKLLVSKGYASKVRWSIGFKEPKDPPPELDYDLWLGPAPMQPYNENFVHYNWHWFWDFGNGEIGNQGVHQMDIARWAIEAATGATGPKSAISMGGRFGYKDQGQTPNMQLCVYDYGGTLLVFEVRGLVGKKGKGGEQFARKVTNEFYLEEGAIIGGQFYPKGKNKPEKLVEAESTVRSGGHFGNFIDCVRSRKQEDLNADILQGHYAAAPCHLGNISYRLGQEVPLGQEPAGFPLECPQVRESLDTIKANLKAALGIDPDKAKWTLGPKLAFDPEKEKFLDHPKADELLTRKYRDPYVMPEEA